MTNYLLVTEEDLRVMFNARAKVADALFTTLRGWYHMTGVQAPINFEGIWDDNVGAGFDSMLNAQRLRSADYETDEPTVIVDDYLKKGELSITLTFPNGKQYAGIVEKWEGDEPQ